MSEREAGLLRTRLKTVQVEKGAVFAEIGSTIDRVFFPISGLLNNFVLTQEGQAVRMGTIGCDSAIGINFDVGRSSVRIVAQLPCTLLSISIPHFREIVETSPHLRKQCAIAMEDLLRQARSAAVCNLLHSAEQRFCRLLLETSDNTSADEVAFTHEALSEIIGVQRSFVTKIATSLRKAGAIECRRGIIRISDRRLLKQMACECYQRSGSSPEAIP